MSMRSPSITHWPPGRTMPLSQRPRVAGRRGIGGTEVLGTLGDAVEMDAVGTDGELGMEPAELHREEGVVPHDLVFDLKNLDETDEDSVAIGDGHAVNLAHAWVVDGVRLQADLWLGPLDSIRTGGGDHLADALP